MKLTIEKVVLWHRNAPSVPPQVFDLSTRSKNKGTVHVFLGTNGTGKTAFLHVVDYCLGADRSSIPMDRPYREDVAWYGLILLDGQGNYYFVARGSPHQGLSDAFCFESVDSDEVKAWLPEANMGRDRFLMKFGVLLGMDMDSDLLPEPSEDGGGRSDEDEGVMVSPHDLSPLLLLPSDYLASSEGMFYTRHVKLPTLKRAMPLALGAINRETVLMRVEHTRLRRTVNALKKVVQESSDQLAGLEGALRAVYERGVELGLIESRPDEPELSIGMMLAHTAQLYATLTGAKGESPISALLTTLQTLRTRDRSLTQKVSGIAKQLNEAFQSRQIAEAAQDGNRAASGRLHALHWVRDHHNGQHPCPLCGADSTIAGEAIARTSAAIEKHELDRNAIQILWRGFDQDVSDLQVKLLSAQSELNQVRTERVRVTGVLQGHAEGLADLTLRELERIEARAAMVLSSQRQLDRLDRRREEWASTHERMKSIESQLDAVSFENKQADQTSLVQDYLTYFAGLMELSHRDDDIHFSLETLDLQFMSSSSGRKRRTKLKASQIGGAMNWMGYKVAVHLALHDVFAGEEYSPVPSFVIIDQFSVVDSSTADPEAAGITRRVYDMLAHIAKSRALQVIVLGGLQDESHWTPDAREVISVVDRWPTEGVGLIPASWGSGEAE